MANAAPFDPADYLKTATARAEYITAALETNDPAFIRDAVGVVARSMGMSKVAKHAGVTREGLYKAFGPSGNPEFGTVIGLMAALQLKLSAGAQRRQNLLRSVLRINALAVASAGAGELRPAGSELSKLSAGTRANARRSHRLRTVHRSASTQFRQRIGVGSHGVGTWAAPPAGGKSQTVTPIMVRRCRSMPYPPSDISAPGVNMPSASNIRPTGLQVHEPDDRRLLTDAQLHRITAGTTPSIPIPPPSPRAYARVAANCTVQSDVNPQ